MSSAIVRLDINELVEKAQIELDDMIFVCKRYEGMSREIHGQVTRDINYLLKQINDLSRMGIEATSEYGGSAWHGPVSHGEVMRF